MFVVFAGDHYYPNGGFKDYKKSFDTHEDAIAWLRINKFDWWEIVRVGDDLFLRVDHNELY